jgi:hypothetical protein
MTLKTRCFENYVDLHYPYQLRSLAGAQLIEVNIFKMVHVSLSALKAIFFFE